MKTKEVKDLLKELPVKQEGQLNIYMHVSENSGVGYYRQYLPAKTLADKKIHNVLISDFRWGEGDHIEPALDKLFDIARWADIVIVGRKDVSQFYAQWGGIREFFNIPIVMDTDDNVRFVSPYNPGYQGYHPGSEAIVWNKFSVSKVFDAITVSTENLKKFHEKENPRIYLLPNYLDMKWWDAVLNKENEDGSLRICFIGSSAHGEGVNLIKKPVKEIMEKYPQARFVITHVYRNMFDDWSESLRNRIEFAPWFKLEEWPQGMKGLRIDIGLAPLTDNMFNRAKSNLRWLEYSACKIPTIASAVSPYLCINNWENGIIVIEQNEWFNAIEKLVLDKELRYNIREAAYREISMNFDIDKNISLWDNAYREIYKKFHDFWGPKKRFEKVGKGKYREIRLYS